MYADNLEALVLSGELFNGGERSSSPVRSESPSSLLSDQDTDDKGWHDEDVDPNSSSARLAAAGIPVEHQESIGMGPGRTGVKGVIRDRDEAREIAQEKRNREMAELAKQFEKHGNLGGKTFLEEEREKNSENEKVDPLVLQERERELARRDGKRGPTGGLRDLWGRPRQGRFGHLREIGLSGFVGAVEKEERGVWVVVHLFEPSLDRCYDLDETLTGLAKMYPMTKFLRCRAAALGFASTSSSSSSKPKTQSNTITRAPRSQRLIDHDDDDLGLEDDVQEDEDWEEKDAGDRFEEDDVDTDMLPTMLVYRDGELVHNWVRVDWEAGNTGIEDLLERHHILPQQRSIFGTDSDGDDGDEDDLNWDL